MTNEPRRPNQVKTTDTRKYTLWAWLRAYAVFFLCLPLFPVFMLLSGRTLPAWATRKLLRAHRQYTESRKMDFRIPPNQAIPAYMHRWWRVPRNWAFNVYYHIVLRSDDDRALHDHPWFNFSLVLDGGYYEHTILEGGIHRKVWFGPGKMKFRWHGKKAHRLELAIHEGPAKHPGRVTDGEIAATTIFITGPVLRRWGFHHESGWVDAYDWDAFCDANNIEQAMRMDGGSDGAISDRNKHNFN